MRRRRRVPPGLLAVLGLIGVPLVFHILISYLGHPGVELSLFGICRIGIILAAALTHWLLYAGLLTTFALTLRRGHTALITEMAYRLHGRHIPAELERYTRNVTIAWSVFFFVQMMTSILLFSFTTLETWSYFVNVMDIPLVAAFFGAEYLIRQMVLDDPPKHSLSQIISMVKDCAERPSLISAPRSD